MFSWEYYEIFMNTYCEEHLRTTASYFMKKNRNSWTFLKNFKSTEIYDSSIL